MTPYQQQILKQLQEAARNALGVHTQSVVDEFLMMRKFENKEENKNA